MTVAELIAELQKYPSDMEVTAECIDGGSNHTFSYSMLEDDYDWISSKMQYQTNGKKVVVLK